MPLVMCPECGQEVVMIEREHEGVEAHGLDCGPFERFRDRWWECPACRMRFTAEELGELVLL